MNKNRDSWKNLELVDAGGEIKLGGATKQEMFRSKTKGGHYANTCCFNNEPSFDSTKEQRSQQHDVHIIAFPEVPNVYCAGPTLLLCSPPRRIPGAGRRIKNGLGPEMTRFWKPFPQKLTQPNNGKHRQGRGGGRPREEAVTIAPLFEMAMSLDRRPGGQNVCIHLRGRRRG